MQAETKEFAWTANLDKTKKVVKWAGRQDGALEQIVLKLAVLGPGCKEGERNLVELTTFNCDQEKVKSCICSLTLGKNENQQLSDLSIFPPANLTLVEGSGPVHVIANHIILEEDDDLSEDDEEESLSESEMMEDLREKLKSKKGKGKGDAPSKQSKNGKAEDDDDMDDDDFDEDEDDEKDDEEDDMDDDDADLGEEAEEEEEEEAVAPTKKRKLTNGKAAEAQKKPTTPERPEKKANNVQKTPKAQKESPTKTPKGEKKTPGKVYTSVEQVKSAIQKYPGGKPRKEDKFCNWVQNTFRVSEASWVSDLWKWHKKEMGM